MTVSVRMSPLLEKELELAARRLGITKTQFIISAVERALGRTDPATLYLKAMEEAARCEVGIGLQEPDRPADETDVKRRLRVVHQRQQDEYAAYLQQRASASKDRS